MQKPQIPYPTLPGEMLTEEFLVPLEMTQSGLARKIGIAPRTINEICNGKRSISPKMALLLSKALKTTPELWMNLQVAWDLWREWEKLKKAG